MSIDIADVNPGDELTVKIGSMTACPESWATLSGKVCCDPWGCLELGEIPVRYPDAGISPHVREIVSHTPAKPDEPENIDIADVNPGDELTVKIGKPGEPEYWATLTGKVRCDSWGPGGGYLTLGEVPVRYLDAGIGSLVREVVSHTPAKPAEPENIGAAVEDADGQVWVRVMWGPGNTAWRNTKPDLSDRRNLRPYDAIEVVKVLHEGWPA